MRALQALPRLGPLGRPCFMSWEEDWPPLPGGWCEAQGSQVFRATLEVREFWAWNFLSVTQREAGWEFS